MVMGNGTVVHLHAARHTDRAGLQLAGILANDVSVGLVTGLAQGATIMADLLKLGTKWINLDHVMEIHDNITSLRVYYRVTHGAQNEIDYTEILGSEASALRTFLDGSATDVLAAYGGTERERGSATE